MFRDFPELSTRCLCCIRFISAGRLWDILNELACAGDIPVDKTTPPPQSNKRERGADSPASTGSSPGLSQRHINPDGSRPIAGRRGLGSVSAVSTAGVAKAPSPGSSSLAAGAGGLPYDTEYLARANLEFVAGMPATNNGMELSWLSTSQTPQAQSMPASGVAGSQQQQPAYSSGASTSANSMPNLNIFDLFQTEPQLFNMPTMDQGYVPNMAAPQQAGPSADATSSYGGRLPENYGQMEGSVPSVNEALQMWSSAPTSFE